MTPRLWNCVRIMAASAIAHSVPTSAVVTFSYVECAAGSMWRNAAYALVRYRSFVHSNYLTTCSRLWRVMVERHSVAIGGPAIRDAAIMKSSSYALA